jgi:hypothetical protein
VLTLTDNNEMVQFPPVVSTNGTSKAASPHMYCFPVTQTNRATAKSNGYLLAETALTSTKNKVGRCLAAVPVHLKFFPSPMQLFYPDNGNSKFVKNEGT